MYALNAQTGELIWKVRPADHFSTMATATPRFLQGSGLPAVRVV